MKHYIDLAQWKRREHFELFSSFDDPMWGITTRIDCTPLYLSSKANGGSFFLHSLHWLMRGVNATEAFRLRIEGDRVAAYDCVGVSPTIARPDGTFGFGYFAYDDDLEAFSREARREMERVIAAPGLAMNADTERADLIYYSALPWFTFTEMKHATSFGGRGNSVPRLTTGKLTREGDRYLLPLSVCVHHGLADGRDIALLLDFLARNPEA